MSRADRITQARTQPVIFSDLDISMEPHPLSGDLSLVTNSADVVQSCRTLIRTRKGSRFYRSDIGCDVERSLFEPNDAVSRDDLVYSIRTTIDQYEPRAQLVSVTATSPNDNSMEVTIVIAIRNTQQLATITEVFKRVR